MLPVIKKGIDMAVMLVNVAKSIVHIFEEHCCGENFRYLV
jgi:hypothetical protein